jgi:GMP synthase-like glutamine amidotransferase
MKLLIIKNGICETDVGTIIHEIDPEIKSEIKCSRNINYRRLRRMKYDAVIILGGAQSLTKLGDIEYNHPYLLNLMAQIKLWIDSGTNVLGICLGEQLIAMSLGHDVVKCSMPKCGYDQNMVLTTIGEEDPMFDYDFNLIRPYFLSLHNDRVSISKYGKELEILCELNPGTSSSIVYAFRHKTAIGVQFHPDITKKILNAFCEEFDICPSLIEECEEINHNINIASLVFFRTWLETFTTIDPIKN